LILKTWKPLKACRKLDLEIRSIPKRQLSSVIEMAEPQEQRRVEPRKVRHRATSSVSGASSAYGLPAEVLDTAVGRLGFLGFVIALMGPSIYLFEHFTQRAMVAGPLPPAAAVILFVAGSSVCVLAWGRKIQAELLLDLGLVLQVIVAFAISLFENAPPWPAGQEIRGISWNCLWISMYVVTIPGTYGKTVLAAITAACMVPFGLLVATVVNGNEIPNSIQLMYLLLPPFITAGWAIPVARHFYHLGTQVSRARAMGSYELLELIGKGGMGEVWSARHRMLTRISAMKLIRPESLLVESGENAQVLLRRFEREARATAALRSPHTVALYDYGTSDDGSFYYVMELLEGLDLESLVHRFGPISAGRVIYLLSQALKSLAEAHEKGLVHRDVKPRNIFTCRMATEHDFVKVLDFGLVRLKATGPKESRLTAIGVTTGTPAFMAPEVATGNPDIDGRADLYSLGCVGYWLLTGQLVFEAENPMAIAIAHVQSPPVPPSQRTEMAVPASLERVILQCLEKDPARRPETARKLLDLLAACDGAEPWTPKEAERWWDTHMPHKSFHPSGAEANLEDETR
jgi:serine/threonine-protein kinase